MLSMELLKAFDILLAQKNNRQSSVVDRSEMTIQSYNNRCFIFFK